MKENTFKFSKEAIPEDIWVLRDILKDFEIYPVGGIVRDPVRKAMLEGETLVRGVPDREWDLATSARPEVVMERMADAGLTALGIGLEHGTVTVLVDHRMYEITTFRTDVTTDGRHAEVQFGCTLEQDILRRDLTINALALDLKTLQVLDLCGGLEDLRVPLVRTVGVPNRRFKEDFLRLLRTIRFATLLDAEIEEKTWIALVENASGIQGISAERIRDELMRMMEAEKPSVGFELMHRSGLLKETIPELDQCFDVQQNIHHSHDVARHSLLSADAVPRRFPFLRMIALLHDLGKPEAKTYLPEREDYVFYKHERSSAELAIRVLKRLRFSNREIKQADTVIREHMFRLTDPTLGKKGLRRFICRVGRKNLEAFIRVRIADRKGNLKWGPGMEPGLYDAIRSIQEILRDEEALSVKDLAIGGQDLIELGMKPGPRFSTILDQLLEMVLDDPSLNTRELLLEKVSEINKEAP